MESDQEWRIYAKIYQFHSLRHLISTSSHHLTSNQNLNTNLGHALQLHRKMGTTGDHRGPLTLNLTQTYP